MDRYALSAAKGQSLALTAEHKNSRPPMTSERMISAILRVSVLTASRRSLQFNNNSVKVFAEFMSNA
jgi:hypothetical protein